MIIIIHPILLLPLLLTWCPLGFSNELSQITKLRTYKFIPLPPGRSAIGSKWVYKVKRENVGDITQYHVHVVAQGYTQHPGIDFFEMYAPVAQIESVQILLSIKPSLDWEIHLIDVEEASCSTTTTRTPWSPLVLLIKKYLSPHP